MFLNGGKGMDPNRLVVGRRFEIAVAWWSHVCFACSEKFECGTDCVSKCVRDCAESSIEILSTVLSLWEVSVVFFYR